MNTNWTTRIAAGLAAAVTMTTALAATAAPASASDLTKALGLDNNNRSSSSSRQSDKNNMRNLGIGLGAVAAYEVLKGNTTAGVLLGAGAAYAGKKYEDARKAQSQDNRWDNGYRRVYRYRNGDRVGYDEYRNGRRTSYYERQRSGNNWSDRYNKSFDY